MFSRATKKKHLTIQHLGLPHSTSYVWAKGEIYSHTAGKQTEILSCNRVKTPAEKQEYNLRVKPRCGGGTGMVSISYRRPPPLRFCTTTSSWTVKINVARSDFKPSYIIDLGWSSPCFKISAVVLSCKRAGKILTGHKGGIRRKSSR